MKSEKAKNYLGLRVDRGGCVNITEAVQAVEIAEEEVLTRAYQELTRWHDPEEMLPAQWQEVLLKIQDSDGDFYYRVGILCNNDCFQYTGYCTSSKIIGWRKIYANL